MQSLFAFKPQASHLACGFFVLMTFFRFPKISHLAQFLETYKEVGGKTNCDLFS